MLALISVDYSLSISQFAMGGVRRRPLFLRTSWKSVWPVVDQRRDARDGKKTGENGRGSDACHGWSNGARLHWNDEQPSYPSNGRGGRRAALRLRRTDDSEGDGLKRLKKKRLLQFGRAHRLLCTQSQDADATMQLSPVRSTMGDGGGRGRSASGGDEERREERREVSEPLFTRRAA